MAGRASSALEYAAGHKSSASGGFSVVVASAPSAELLGGGLGCGEGTCGSLCITTATASAKLARRCHRPPPTRPPHPPGLSPGRLWIGPRARGPGGAKALGRGPGPGNHPPNPQITQALGYFWPKNHLGTCRILSLEPIGYGFLLLLRMATHTVRCAHIMQDRTRVCKRRLQSASVGLPRRCNGAGTAAGSAKSVSGSSRMHIEIEQRRRTKTPIEIVFAPPTAYCTHGG